MRTQNKSINIFDKYKYKRSNMIDRSNWKIFNRNDDMEERIKRMSLSSDMCNTPKRMKTLPRSSDRIETPDGIKELSVSGMLDISFDELTRGSDDNTEHTYENSKTYEDELLPSGHDTIISVFDDEFPTDDDVLWHFKYSVLKSTRHLSKFEDAMSFRISLFDVICDYLVYCKKYQPTTNNVPSAVIYVMQNLLLTVGRNASRTDVVVCLMIAQKFIIVGYWFDLLAAMLRYVKGRKKVMANREAIILHKTGFDICSVLPVHFSEMCWKMITDNNHLSEGITRIKVHIEAISEYFLFAPFRFNKIKRFEYHVLFFSSIIISLQYFGYEVDSFESDNGFISDILKLFKLDEFITKKLSECIRYLTLIAGREESHEYIEIDSLDDSLYIGYSAKYYTENKHVPLELKFITECRSCSLKEYQKLLDEYPNPRLYK